MSRLTHDRVIEIAGTLTDSQIARILECGAEEDELLAAVTWLGADDYLGREKLEEPSGRVAALCEILESEEPAPEETRD
jgi:hypothetical protein